MKRGILLLSLPVVASLLAVFSLFMRRETSTARAKRPPAVSTNPLDPNPALPSPFPATERLPADRRAALADFVTEFKCGGSPVLPAGDLSEDDVEFLAQEMGR